MEESTKPPVKTQVLTQPSEEDVAEGKGGMADDNEPFPRNVEARCKLHEKGDCSRKGSTIERCGERLASQTAQATGRHWISNNFLVSLHIGIQ